MNLRTRVLVVIVASGVSAAAVFPAVSGATPIEDKRRQAAELGRQIEENDGKLVRLSEQLNGARYRRAQAEEAIGEAQARTDAAIAERRKIRGLLGQRAAQIYRNAGSATPLQLIDVSSISEMAARSKYASAAADRDDQLMTKLRNAEDDLAVRKDELERQRAAAEAEASTADAARAKLDATNREAQALRSQVSGEIAALVEKEAQARAAAAQRAATANAQRAAATSRTAGGGASNAPPPNFVDAPAPNGGAAAAVAFAKAQVGKGYRFATAGPDTFDCSGLTSAAWARGGVSLTRYSGAQYQQTMRIGRGDLQPGDLLFYGPNASDHVSMYVGGGMVVSASNPSVGVRYVPIYGSPMGYGRVRG